MEARGGDGGGDGRNTGQAYLKIGKVKEGFLEEVMPELSLKNELGRLSPFSSA